jgi:hypothetical protein
MMNMIIDDNGNPLSKRERRELLIGIVLIWLIFGVLLPLALYFAPGPHQ